jgi:hypothetical protein
MFRVLVHDLTERNPESFRKRDHRRDARVDVAALGTGHSLPQEPASFRHFSQTQPSGLPRYLESFHCIYW